MQKQLIEIGLSGGSYLEILKDNDIEYEEFMDMIQDVDFLKPYWTAYAEYERLTKLERLDYDDKRTELIEEMLQRIKDGDGSINDIIKVYGLLYPNDVVDGKTVGTYKAKLLQDRHLTKLKIELTDSIKETISDQMLNLLKE